MLAYNRDLRLGSPKVDPLSHFPHNRILWKAQSLIVCSLLLQHNVQDVMGLFMQIKALTRYPLGIKLNGIRTGEINEKPGRGRIFAKERAKVYGVTI